MTGSPLTGAPSDALVVFGVTGDPAFKQIFPALQAMIRHGHLNAPVMGVARSGWTLETLRARVHESLEQHGGVDPEVSAHLCRLLQYVGGDYEDPGTCEALREALNGAASPVHYLAIPPSLFTAVAAGLARAGAARNARVIVEKPCAPGLGRGGVAGGRAGAGKRDAAPAVRGRHLGARRGRSPAPERRRLAQPRPGVGLRMTPRPDVVFLFDVDNTLLDNDRIIVDLRRFLTREVGAGCAEHYFEIFEQLRAELGYADYLGALQRYRVAYPRDPRLLALSSYLVNYPFADRLYPGSLDVLEHVAAFGPTVILTDGDVVFQPRKIEQSGLGAAVEKRILVYIHKEQELDDVVRRFPAEHYVLVDDKLRILAAVKQAWRAQVTTVFPRQGHYAHDRDILASYPPADVSVARIGDLLGYDLTTLLGAATAASGRRNDE
jgi:FMN phosphatase YigB (HAD superfamily)